MKPRSILPFATLLAIAGLFPSAAAARQTNRSVYMPTPGSGETALLSAVDKLCDELDDKPDPGDDWEPSFYSSPPSPSTTEMCVVVSIDGGHTGFEDNGYRLEGLQITDLPLYVEAKNLRAAIDGVHGLRLFLLLNGYSVVNVAKTVNPAFDRRGFQVLPGEDWTTEEWKDYIDLHQLLGANTITFQPQSVFFQATSSPRTAHLAAKLDQLEGLKDYCNDIGMRFQLNTAANHVDPDFYWANLTPEEDWYDSAGETAMPLPASDIGADVVDGFGHAHPVPYFGAAAASMHELDAQSLDDEVAGAQLDFYERFSDAFGFVVGINEPATDLGPDAVDTPLTEILQKQLDWVVARVDDGHTAGPLPRVIYWGWLHDLWYRHYLQDPGYSTHTGFATFQSGAYDVVETALAAGEYPGEWIQEVGYFYGDLGMHNGIATALLSAFPDYLAEDYGLADLQLSDPLGEVARNSELEVTAYLYWSHIEARARNYLPRPCVREMIADMRASLRLQTYSFPDRSEPSADPATGVMGYRFLTPSRQLVNDFVVLRCASDRTLLGHVDANLSNDAEMEPVRDAVLDELAAWLIGGDNHADFAAVRSSVELLDGSRPSPVLQAISQTSGSPADPDIAWDIEDLKASLDALDGVTWLDPSVPNMAWYYPLLAFTVMVEHAASLDPDNPAHEDDIAKLTLTAWGIARQTRELQEYGVYAKVAELIVSLRAQNEEVTL